MVATAVVVHALFAPLGGCIFFFASAGTPIVLDVDGWKCQFNAKNTHRTHRAENS